MTKAIWTAEVVSLRFEEAVETLNKLPSGAVRGYATFWPDVIYTPAELARQTSKPVKLNALPDQITRMEQTLMWIEWANEGERKLIWLRAYQMTWREIARRTGYPRTSAQRYWQGALTKIAVNLEEKNRID